MKTRLLGGVVALVLAIVGAVLLSSYVRASDARAQAGMEPVDIFVVQQPIAAGTAVDQLKDSLKIQSVPKTAVSDGSVGDLAEFTGKVAAVDLVPGEQLLSSRLVDPKSLVNPNRVDVPKGLAEVSLVLAPERVIGADLKAGDTVGIFISYPDLNGEGPATKLQFHKVLVTKVGVGNGSESSGSEPTAAAKPGASIMVTLAQTGADATRTVHGVEFGTIYLSKENAETDTAPVDTLPMNQVLK